MISTATNMFKLHFFTDFLLRLTNFLGLFLPESLRKLFSGYDHLWDRLWYWQWKHNWKRADIVGNQQLYRVAVTLPFLKICQKKVKGKAVPLQGWSGPEGSRKLRFTDFMTTAQDGGKVVSLTHRTPLPPGNTPRTHFLLESESNPWP
jgi:hypothetical protein